MLPFLPYCTPLPPQPTLQHRAAFGAFLSIGDMVSDLLVINEYFRSGNNGAAQTLAAMIGISFFIQLIIVIGQNIKRTGLPLVKEIFILLTCLKPAVDAYRVGVGSEKKLNATFSPVVEMMFGKATELAAESIPGSLLQGEWAKRANYNCFFDVGRTKP